VLRLTPERSWGATNAAVTFLPDAPFYSEDCRPSAKEGRG
jgi:hypothetical protein